MISYMNKIREDYFNNVTMRSTREGFGDGLLNIGQDPRVFALCADLTESVKMDKFAKEYKERFVEVGIAEQNMASVASGIAAMGMVPFIASYATFNPGRNWEQIRTTIAYNNLPVRIIGAHAGLMTGPDGGTHQMLEDISLMRSLPNIKVLVPADYVEAKAMTEASLDMDGPVYIRMQREKERDIFDESYKYDPRLKIVYRNKKETDVRTHSVVVVCAGPIINEAIAAAKELSDTSIRVDIVNCSTIKPIDGNGLKKIAEIYKKIIVVEEHQIIGGLYSAVCEYLSTVLPTKIYPVGVNDRYGQSGTTKELWNEYMISKDYIKDTILRIIND